jgi:hypothetical protein
MEFVLWFGVHAPLNVLDEQPHIQVRQALLRESRLLVAVAFVLTAISARYLIPNSGPATRG